MATSTSSCVCNLRTRIRGRCPISRRTSRRSRVGRTGWSWQSGAASTSTAFSSRTSRRALRTPPTGISRSWPAASRGPGVTISRNTNPMEGLPLPGCPKGYFKGDRPDAGALQFGQSMLHVPLQARGGSRLCRRRQINCARTCSFGACGNHRALADDVPALLVLRMLAIATRARTKVQIRLLHPRLHRESGGA